MVRSVIKTLVCLACMLIGCQVLKAQSFANNLAADSVDPFADSLAISSLRAKLDSIRQAEHRPTVALVLSGGGAKGAAYIGIFRYLEEMGIPIDMMCGTSMGGLMGGLYSMGYDSHELESIISSVDWNVVMSDDIEMRFLPFNRRTYSSKYVISIPFFYDDATHTKRMSLFDAPLGDSNLESSGGQRKVLSLIPSGYITGYNVENMLSNLTVGFHDDMNFKDLPIPFYCVSSDLVSAKAFYHTGGSITKAMRATMSIPGVFTPVRYKSRILVDGGTRNNFPVDFAKAAGADIIIGVEVAKRSTTYSEVNTVVDVVNCMITMLGDDARSNKQAQPDYLIKPDTGGKNMLSFDSESIAEMIDYGYKAAVDRREDFLAIKKQLGDSLTPADARPTKKAVNLYANDVNVTGIMVNGIDRDEQKMFRKILDLRGYQRLSVNDINDAMNRVMASGSFETVNFSLLKNDDDDDSYTLSFDCAPGKIHHFGVSARMDTEEFAELMVNLRLNAHKLRGWLFDATAKISSQASLDLTLSHIPDNFAQINFDASVRFVRSDILAENAQNYNVSMINASQTISVSTIHAKNCDIHAGIRHEMANMPKDWILFAIPEGGVSYEALPEYFNSAHYLTAFIHTKFNTMNDRQFPTKGFVGGFGFEYDLANFKAIEFNPVPIVNLDAKIAIPVTNWFTLVPDISYRGYFSDYTLENQRYDVIHNNYVGGAIKARYVEQQLPFVGFTDMCHMKNQVWTANLDARFQLGKKLYLSALLGAVRDEDKFSDMFSSLSPHFWGCGLEAGVRTFFGPIKANIHWNDSDFSNRFGYYLSVGFDF